MKITLLTYGSRGDVQPFIALAVGLKKAGHDPLLAAPKLFSDLAERYKVPFHSLPGDPEEISARFNDAGQNPVRTMHAIGGYVFQIAPQVAKAALDACHNADLLIHGFLFTAGGHAFAVQQGIPDISVQTFPMFAPTRAFPNVSVAGIPPGWLSLVSHWLFDLFFRYGGNLGYQRIRYQHPEIPLPGSLPWPFKKSDKVARTPILFAFSSHVIPPPREWQRQAHIHLPGYFMLEDFSYVPPKVVLDFLAAGTPPICITFGSMVNRYLDRIRSVMFEALHHTHQRAIILTGWGSWGDSPVQNGILMHDKLPHSWLFPQCKLLIHHGGAGTTAAALQSGIPSMIVPFAGDQPFWADVVNRLGVGPKSIRVKNLCVDKLEQAFLDAELPIYQIRAKELGETLRSEDGVEAAVRFVDQMGVGVAGNRSQP